MRTTRFFAMVFLGVFRARENRLVKASLVFGLILALGSIGLAVMLSSHSQGQSGLETLVRFPIAATSVMAWAAGVLVAFSASSRALIRDQEQGVHALTMSRGTTPMNYVLGRALGLALVLFLLTGATSLATGLAIFVTSRPPLKTLAEGSLAALAFALMFSLSVAPLSLAALGARSRAGGYLALVFILALPELFVKYIDRILPPGWGEVASVPSALSSLASSLAPGTLDVVRLTKSLIVLIVVMVVSLLVVRVELARVKERTT